MSKVSSLIGEVEIAFRQGTSASRSKASRWTTVRPLLELAGRARGAPSLNASNHPDQYTKISREAADRVMRFLKVRKSASIGDMKPMLASEH
jgi:hypothetical protein